MPDEPPMPETSNAASSVPEPSNTSAASKIPDSSNRTVGLKRKSRWKRNTVVILIGLLLLVYCLPWLVSTKRFYQPFVDRLAGEGFVVEIGSIELDWLATPRIRNISIREPENKPLLQIPEIRADRGLWRLLWSRKELGVFHVVDPRVDVEILDDHGESLKRMVQAIKNGREKNKGDRAFPKVRFSLKIEGIHAQVQRPGDKQPWMVIPPADLQLDYYGTDPQPRLIAHPTKLLDEVVLTEELLRFGLDHAVPLLADSASFDGRISLELGKLEIPLDSPEDSLVSALMTLHEVRSRPRNPHMVQVLEFVSQLRRSNVEPSGLELVFIDGSQIAIEVRERRVQHQGLQVGLPKIDSRLQLATQGSVGMDRSIDLQMEFPVPLEQLAFRESVQKLGVPMVKLPLTGSLDEPRIDWDFLRKDSAGLIGLIRSQLQEEAPGTAAALEALEGITEGQADQAIEAAADLFQAIRQRRQAARDAERPTADPAEAESTSPAVRPLRDRLRNMLRGEK